MVDCNSPHKYAVSRKESVGSCSGCASMYHVVLALRAKRFQAFSTQKASKMSENHAVQHVSNRVLGPDGWHLICSIGFYRPAVLEEEARPPEYCTGPRVWMTLSPETGSRPTEPPIFGRWEVFEGPLDLPRAL